MIFYFSCTGNTLWAARKVAEATGDSLINIASLPYNVNDNVCNQHDSNHNVTYDFELKPGESIGFFFPVHGWRPPLNVRRFISKLRISNSHNHYCYAVCTAGDTVGEAMKIFEHDLSLIGISLQSCISLIMPESYVGLPFMDVDTPQREAEKKYAADRHLADFINDIYNHTAGIRDLTIGNWPRINSRIIGSVFINQLITDRPFHVDANRCLHCGKCASVCPVGDIECNKGDLPTWLHNGKCLTCFSCYHHCPTKAISFGWRTKHKGQYYYEKRRNV